MFRWRLLLLPLLFLPVLAGLLTLALLRRPPAVQAQAGAPLAADYWFYLPLITNPPPLTYSYSNVLANGSFEAGWDTVANGNQQPYGWTLSWLPNGALLYDDPAHTATAVPEIVHKLSHQLPPDEQLGGANALILDGDATYKIFQDSQTFGAELRQTVSGLIPGTAVTLTVPVQLHWRPSDSDLSAAESGAWLNGQGQWANMSLMADRQWYTHTVTLTVPQDGIIEVVIRVKSKWAIGKDFFIDDARLMAAVPEA